MEAVLRECVPLFADTLSLEVIPLVGVVSLNNKNYKVHAHGTAYLWRVGTESAHFLGVQRKEEQAAARAAAAAGIGPALLFADPVGGMLQPFLNARHWTQEEAQKPENIVRIAQTLRRLHTITEVDAPCSVYERIERLLASAAKLGLEPPPELASLRKWLSAIQVQRSDQPLGLCHGDFWLNNFLVDEEQLWLIDWEFSGLGDGLYDLATIAMGASYSPEQQQALLDAYGTGETQETLEQMKMVVRFFEGAWALVQHGLRGSQDGFDYLTYSQKTFAAITQ